LLIISQAFSPYPLVLQLQIDDNNKRGNLSKCYLGVLSCSRLNLHQSADLRRTTPDLPRSKCVTLSHRLNFPNKFLPSIFAWWMSAKQLHTWT